MPIYGRCYEPGQLQFITTSTYRRVPAFPGWSYGRRFVQGVRADRFRLDRLG